MAVRWRRWATTVILVIINLQDHRCSPTLQPQPTFTNRQHEVDSEESRKVLGSSVVTSVSVITDHGNGTKTYLADGLDNAEVKSNVIGSPINLLNPDRYEFYTFDETGDLVKRLMTWDEIQGLIAGGDTEALLGEASIPIYYQDAAIPDRYGQTHITANDFQTPDIQGVHKVVESVQNVLKSELAATQSKVPPVAKPDLISNSPGWSLFLPSLLDNMEESGSDISHLPSFLHPSNGNQGLQTTTSTTTPASLVTFSSISDFSTSNKEHSKKTEKPTRIKTTTSKPSTYFKNTTIQPSMESSSVIQNEYISKVSSKPTFSDVKFTTTESPTKPSLTTENQNYSTSYKPFTTFFKTTTVSPPKPSVESYTIIENQYISNVTTKPSAEILSTKESQYYSRPTVKPLKPSSYSSTPRSSSTTSKPIQELTVATPVTSTTSTSTTTDVLKEYSTPPKVESDAQILYTSISNVLSQVTDQSKYPIQLSSTDYIPPDISPTKYSELSQTKYTNIVPSYNETAMLQSSTQKNSYTTFNKNVTTEKPSTQYYIRPDKNNSTKLNENSFSVSTSNESINRISSGVLEPNGPAIFTKISQSTVTSNSVKESTTTESLEQRDEAQNKLTPEENATKSYEQTTSSSLSTEFYLHTTMTTEQRNKLGSTTEESTTVVLQNSTTTAASTTDRQKPPLAPLTIKPYSKPSKPPSGSTSRPVSVKKPPTKNGTNTSNVVKKPSQKRPTVHKHPPSSKVPTSPTTSNVPTSTYDSQQQSTFVLLSGSGYNNSMLNSDKLVTEQYVSSVMDHTPQPTKFVNKVSTPRTTTTISQQDFQSSSISTDSAEEKNNFVKLTHPSQSTNIASSTIKQSTPMQQNSSSLLSFPLLTPTTTASLSTITSSLMDQDTDGQQIFSTNTSSNLSDGNFQLVNKTEETTAEATKFPTFLTYYTDYIPTEMKSTAIKPYNRTTSKPTFYSKITPSNGEKRPMTYTTSDLYPTMSDIVLQKIPTINPPNKSPSVNSSTSSSAAITTKYNSTTNVSTNRRNVTKPSTDHASSVENLTQISIMLNKFNETNKSNTSKIDNSPTNTSHSQSHHDVTTDYSSILHEPQNKIIATKNNHPVYHHLPPSPTSSSSPSSTVNFQKIYSSSSNYGEEKENGVIQNGISAVTNVLLQTESRISSNGENIDSDEKKTDLEQERIQLTTPSFNFSTNYSTLESSNIPNLSLKESSNKLKLGTSSNISNANEKFTENIIKTVVELTPKPDEDSPATITSSTAESNLGTNNISRTLGSTTPSSIKELIETFKSNRTSTNTNTNIIDINEDSTDSSPDIANTTIATYETTTKSEYMKDEPEVTTMNIKPELTNNKDQQDTNGLEITEQQNSSTDKYETQVNKTLSSGNSTPVYATTFRGPSLGSLRPTASTGHNGVDLPSAPHESMGLEASVAFLGDDVKRFVDLCNELSFKIWTAQTAKGFVTSRSIVLSPFAAISTLAMIFLGARGSSSGQMNEFLRLDDMVTFNPHQVFQNITESTVNTKNIGVSNAAFVRELYSDKGKGKILDFYKERVQQYYDGHVEEINFNSIGDLVRRRTNLLVKRQTLGRVQDYLRGSALVLKPPLASLTANVFQTDCDIASTEGRDGEMYFVVRPSTRQRRLVPIPAVVFRSGFLAGYEPGIDATAVTLSSESMVSTILILPGQQGQVAPGDGLARLEQRLLESSYRKGSWSRLLRSLLFRPGLELQIPRFSHRSVLNLTAGFQRMGLGEIFADDKADLRGVNGLSNDLHLSDIVQVNTFSTCGEDVIGARHHVETYPSSPQRVGRMRVVRRGRSLDEDDETSTTYSSLPLNLRPRQARLPDTPRLRYDRPFLYVVRHNPTGMILYIGRFNPRLIP